VARRFIDISVPLEDVPMNPEHHRPKIDYVGHDDSWSGFHRYYPGVPKEDIIDGKAWAGETVTLMTHSGTHMDAPWHYHPTQDGGAPAVKIDEIPLDWCMRPGVKLDFREVPDGHVVTAAEIDAELARIDYELQPFDIVLCNTRAGERFGQADYVDSGCGFGREATLHLAERGIKIVGTDGWSWDAPFSATARRYAETGDASLIWEGHKAGRERGYCQLEKLHGLEQLPATGFTVICFPVKITGASAGWTRCVAVLP
jgi:kynurenine formamidase